MPISPTSKYLIPCSREKSRISLACSAEAMSLLGTKWSGTMTILDGSKTFFTPSRRNSRMAMGAVISLERTMSTRTLMNSPGLTSLLSAWAARIFSDKFNVIPLFKKI